MIDLKLLFSNLIRLETELWDAVEARLRADYDLPLSWFEPMQIIDRHAACRVFDIASELAITIGGTSKLVDRIEAAGFCQRRANPDDRRSSLIELTPVGKCLLRNATTAFEAELELRLGAVLSATELQQFSATIARLRVAGHYPPSTERTT